MRNVTRPSARPTSVAATWYRVVAGLALAVVTGASPAHAAGDALQSAAHQLIRSQLPSGLLRYDFDFVGGAPSSKDDMVRQAGVVSFMAAYYAHTGDPRMRVAVETALATFGRLSVPVSNGWWHPLLMNGLSSVPVGRQRVWQALDRWGVMYRPHGDGRVLTIDGRYEAADTGATAMALLAELLYFEASGDDRYRTDRMAWRNGLVAGHIPGRGFRSTPINLDESAFYNGEAWLTLAHYHRRYPQDAVVAGLLTDLDAYLMHRYENDLGTGFYQWGTMAAALRFQTTSDPRFFGFIARQAEKALDEAPWSETRDRNTCSMVEGLATAAGLLSSHSQYAGLSRRLAHKVDMEMTKNRRFQIPANVNGVVLGGGAYLMSPHLAEFAGAFLADTSGVYTRIDYTGHCMAAMLKRTPPRAEAKA